MPIPRPEQPWPNFDAWWQSAAGAPERDRVLLGGEGAEGRLFCASGRFEGRDGEAFIFRTDVAPATDKLAATFYWMALERQIRLEGTCAAVHGGLRLVPSYVEFWQEGAYRLHERLRYLREGEGWRINLLYP